jgi:SAM-dependent methyltransferase
MLFMTQHDLERLRAQTRSYQTDPAFLAGWTGLSPNDVLLRTAQERAFVELMSAPWRDLAGLRILDVGCGSGRWLRWYLELGAEPRLVRGVDVSDCRFDEGRAINAAVEMTMIDGERLPFEDASFDLVTQWVCFMCVPTEAWRRRLAAEMLRVLRPGGYVFWWDTPRANARLTDGLPLDPAAFFPTLPVVRREIAARGRPSESLRSRAAAAMLGPLLDLLAASPTHVAARLGPRP